MKKQIIKLSIVGISAILLLSQTSCTKDYITPNAATEEQVFSSPQGLTGVAVGLQRVYSAGRASSLYNMVTINGLVTKELTVLKKEGPFKLSECRFYEIHSEYMFEHVDLNKPLKVEMTSLHTEHNGFYYDFNFHQSKEQNQTAIAEYEIFKASIKLI